LNTPVVLIAFNRPGVTSRNLEVLREVKPSHLFLVVDGPRRHHPDDIHLCAAVREVLNAVDWPCEVRRRYAERNIGLEANVELGLDWVFGHVEKAIVLEDDCVPDESFFVYCEELLERYAEVKRVWQIAGDNHGVPQALFGGASYDFSTWASVWGWATWSDRWKAHRAVFDRDHAGAADRTVTMPPHRVVPAGPRPGSLVTDAARRHFEFVADSTDGDLYGWDHHWWVTIMSEGGLSATPALNIVENDGFSEGATHTRAKKEATHAVAMPMPLTHPPETRLNQPVERELELILLRTDGRLSRAARRLIRPLWLRAIVRRVVSTPLVWRAVRRIVGQ
jgi:hypothetical protein